MPGSRAAMTRLQISLALVALLAAAAAAAAPVTTTKKGAAAALETPAPAPAPLYDESYLAPAPSDGADGRPVDDGLLDTPSTSSDASDVLTTTAGGGGGKQTSGAGSVNDPSPDAYAPVPSADGSLFPGEAPAPAPVDASPPPPRPPTPPPPPPPSTRVNLVLKIATSASSLPADQAALVASTLSLLTSGTTWTFASQQPAYEHQLPVVPAAAPAPAPAAPSSTDPSQDKVTVDPLPINGLPTSSGTGNGGTAASIGTGAGGGATASVSAATATSGLGRKLRQLAVPGATAAAAPDLPLSAKGRCWSVKHAVTPDEPTCTAWCAAKLAAGDATATEPRAYENEGTLCCRCSSKQATATNTTTDPTAASTAGSPATATTTAPAQATASLAAATSTAPEATQPGATSEAASEATSEAATGQSAVQPDTAGAAVPDASSSAQPTTADPSNAVDAAAPSPAPAAIAPMNGGATDGVYYFASAAVPNKGAEAAANATLQAAASAGRLLSSLQNTAGVSASSVSVMFLGSGAYVFAPLPHKYVRPPAEDAAVASAAPTAAVAPASRTGTNKGLIIGAVAGGLAFLGVLAAVVASVVVRRRRQAAQLGLNGQSMVRRWELERKQAEDHRQKLAEERRQASMQDWERTFEPQRTTRGMRMPNLDRMRSALGLGPKDHLAAAAEKLAAAEAAGGATTPLPAADYNAPNSGKPSPAASVTSEASSGPHTSGSEVPLSSVVVRPSQQHQQQQQQHSWQHRQGGPVPAAARSISSSGPAPSWATRDPAVQQQPGGFGARLNKLFRG